MASHTSSPSDPTTPFTDSAPTAFHHVADYVKLRRQGAVALSPDGTRLIAAASELNADETKYVTALWDVDLAGSAPAQRLTRSAPGEGSPVIRRDNSVLFVSKRPDPAAEKSDDDAGPALWLLPAGGGEARQIASEGAGISGVAAAREADALLVTANLFDRAADREEDNKRRDARKKGKVNAILHSSYMVRYWDHDVGAIQPRLFVGSIKPARDSGLSGGYDDSLELRDLTGGVGRALTEAQVELSADGSFAVATWMEPDGHAAIRTGLVRIDLASGERTELLMPEHGGVDSPALSRDGQHIAFVREHDGSPERAHRITLHVVPVDGGDVRELPLDGLRPSQVTWSVDGSELYVIADEAGRAPVFALDVSTGERRRLVADGAYSSLQVHPDGRQLVAVRSSYTDPGTIVVLDTAAEDQTPRELSGPTLRPALPGTLTEVQATASDGATVRSYLALPSGASSENPAPLILWVHGGPVASWNSWSWRWCPWLLVAQGYAVLMPDPAFSTGYGQEWIERGWGAWGGSPYTDSMAALDGVLAERDDVDASRTGMMGGSFGGYMANWIAGHTDRFKAIVSHAGLWDLPGFGGTTDAPHFWNNEMSPEMAAANTPSASAANITTPMLVIHGDKDYRVPIGEGLRLWWDLLRHADPSKPLQHRFLYYPDENHWILTPNHAIIWYETVLAFLAWHVRGEDFVIPDLV